MADEILQGRVVVVAGDDAALASVARTATSAGARVAVVSATLPDVPCSVRFRADPHLRQTWERVAMHVEQHLGPVDGVAVDPATAAVATEVFGADLSRRGHGAVVVVRPDVLDDPDRPDDVGLLRSMVGTRPAAPSPPPASGPGR